jgi:glycosyltransferase involved in cell wall biosynthesis
VDLERFRPRREDRAMLRARLGIPADAAVIGLVARYHPMKDIETFLRAASRFRHDDEKAKFILCGDGLGPDNEKVTELLSSLGLDHNIVLLGPPSS